MASSRQARSSQPTAPRDVATRLFNEQPKHVHGPWIVVEWEFFMPIVPGDEVVPGLLRATKVACSSCLEPRAVAFDKSNVPTMQS